jgi:hypothetical protein
MDRNIENKILCWLIEKKIKGYSDFDLYDCILDVGLELHRYSDIIRIDKQFRLCEKKINNIILFYEENN